jgi:hypothetical protein
MHFRPHKAGACNYMHIWVHKWRNACRILFRCVALRCARFRRPADCFSKVAADFAASKNRSYFSDLGAAGIRCVSIDFVLLEWRIRKQRDNPDAVMKVARIVNQHRRYSEASKLMDVWFGADFSSHVAVDLSTSAST